MTNAAQLNKELVVGTLDAAIKGDMEAFLGALHPEVEFHEPAYLPYGGVYRGKDAFLELAKKAMDLLDLTTAELISATADEDRCVLLMTISQRSNGERHYITEHWEVEDGLARTIRVFWFGLPT